MTATKRKALATRPARNKVIPGEVNPPPSTDSSSSAEENTLASGVNLTVSRKTNKPLMEKRRRARINESLAQLKDLVVVETDNPSKLEKADILELTVTRVRELREVEKSRNDAFHDGFTKCLETATQFLVGSGLGDLSAQLKSHLTSTTNFCDPLSNDDIQGLPLVTPVTGPIHTTPESQLEDFPSEPINLTLLRPPNALRFCSVWRPW